MNWKKYKGSLYIYLLITIIVFFLVGVASGYYKTEFTKKPFIKQKIKDRDVGYLYDFYISAEPNIDGRPYYGDADAQITMIMYIDPDSDVSRDFFSGIFKDIEKEYIDPGIVRFIHKNLVTIKDYDEKTDRYMYAKGILCAGSLTKNDFYDVYFLALSSGTYRDFIENIKNHGSDMTSFEKCMAQKEFPELMEDISEVENFGISLNPRIYVGVNGKDNTVIDGIPGLKKMKKIIRTYQIRKGDRLE